LFICFQVTNLKIKCSSSSHKPELTREIASSSRILGISSFLPQSGATWNGEEYSFFCGTDILVCEFIFPKAQLFPPEAD